MLRIKSILAGVCFALLFLPFSGHGRDPKLTLLYKGKPLCYWTVTLKLGDVIYGEAVTDSKGVVVFSGVKMPSKAFDLKGRKSTGNGNKSWSIGGVFSFTDDSYTATIEFEEVAATLANLMGASEASLIAGWGVSTDDCSDKPSNSSNSNPGPGAGSSNTNTGSSTSNNQPAEKSLEEKMAEMKAEREQRQADHRAQEIEQKKALEQKLQRLNKKVEEAKAEQAKYQAGTAEYSNASYELRDLEIDRELTQLKLDKMNDQQASNTGLLSKSERQRYNEKTDALEAEQKELRKNKKDGLVYGQKPGTDSKAVSSGGKEENEEDESSLRFYTPEELANMSTFDLKRTRVSNNNSINKRKIKLKAKAAFLDMDKKAKINEEIAALEKQIEAIKAVLAQRNEKEDEEKKE